MNIPLEVAGYFMIAWLIIAIPSLVYLAKRKTTTPELTLVWGIPTLFVPFIGVVLIFILILKNDVDQRSTVEPKSI